MVDYTFGEYLKKNRLEKGVSVEDISSQTKISKHIIGEIESENLDKLPEDVILKGFLRSYSAALNIDPDTVLNMYSKAIASSGRPTEPVFDKDIVINDNKPAEQKRALVLVLAVVALIVLTLSGISLYTHTYSRQSPADISESPAEPTTHFYNLDVECVEKTTLKISIDGKKTETYLLKPKENLTKKAADHFIIWLDNNCGVTFFIDDQPVENKGPCGKESRLILPEE